MKEIYSFVLDNKELLEKLQAVVGIIRQVETICFTDGFNIATCKKCKDYIVYYVIGNTSKCRAMLEGEMPEYFKKQEMILVDAQQNHNISSDIIDSNFGI